MCYKYVGESCLIAFILDIPSNHLFLLVRSMYRLFFFMDRNYEEEKRK